MKKYIYLLLLLYGAPAFSQVEPEGCDINTVSTDPTNYQNSSDPAELQKWDWTIQDYTVYLTSNQFGTSGVQYTIRSPFYDASGNVNTYHYSFPVEKDHKTADGWELLYRNFGSPSQGVVTPYFIMYNRYSGVIRVFANIVNSGEFAYNAAKLELTFQGSNFSQTALLNQLGSTSFSFMDFQSDAMHFAANQYTNSGINNNYFWVTADFNSMYDPCTCDVKSDMIFKVGLINQIDIDMNGFLRQMTLVDAQGPANSAVNNGDFFGKVQRYLQFGSGIVSGVGEIAASGNKGFKAGEDMISEAQKNVMNLGPMIGRQKAKNISRSLGKILFEVPKVNQMLNLASTLITVVKRLSGDFENLNGSVNAMKSPTVTEHKTSVEISGDITLTGSHLNVFLPVPGSKDIITNIVDYKPVYNNVLGTVNLLEQPEFDYIKFPTPGLEYAYVLSHEYDDFYQQFRTELKYFPAIHQLKVKNKPKIILNPASGLKIKSVEYQVVFENGIEYATDFVGPTIPGQLKYFMDLGDEEHFFAKSGKDREDLMQSFGYELDMLDPNNNNDLSWAGATFSTPYMNQDCFNNIGIFSFSEIVNPRVRVKVIMEPINPTPGSEVQEVINILSYPSNIATTVAGSYTVSGLGNNTFIDLPIDESQYLYGMPGDMILQDQVIDHDLYVLGDLTIGNNVSFKAGIYKVKATGNIYYNKTVNFEPVNGQIIPGNYDIEFIAAKEIFTTPESYILPEIDLYIDPSIMLPCQNVADEYPTGAEIANLCNSTKYRNLISRSAKHGLVDEQGNEIIQQEELPFDFTLHPNPSNAQTRLILQNHDPRSTVVRVTDLTGKEITVQLVKMSENSYGFDVSILEKGVYFVTVNSNFQQKTKQLIVH